MGGYYGVIGGYLGVLGGYYRGLLWGYRGFTYFRPRVASVAKVGRAKAKPYRDTAAVSTLVLQEIIPMFVAGDDLPRMGTAPANQLTRVKGLSRDLTLNPASKVGATALVAQIVGKLGERIASRVSNKLTPLLQFIRPLESFVFQPEKSLPLDIGIYGIYGLQFGSQVRMDNRSPAGGATPETEIDSRATPPPR